MKENAVTGEYKLLLRRIGENVAKARQEKGLTQRELAGIANKNQTIIAKLEKFPPVDMTLRSIYEIIRHIPVSCSEIIAKSERDLRLVLIPRKEGMLAERLDLLVDKLRDLTPEEQGWMADMIEGLLSRTSSPSKLPDNPDIRPQVLAA